MPSWTGAGAVADLGGLAVRAAVGTWGLRPWADSDSIPETQAAAGEKV